MGLSLAQLADVAVVRPADRPRATTLLEAENLRFRPLRICGQDFDLIGAAWRWLTALLPALPANGGSKVIRQTTTAREGDSEAGALEPKRR